MSKRKSGSEKDTIKQLRKSIDFYGETVIKK